MAISPPSERLWWNEPIAKIELVWIVVAFLWGVVMFGMMIYWHAEGEQNLSNEAYRTTPEVFAEKANAMVEKYTVREEAGYPVVHPPPGSEVYLIARLWQWWPILELEKEPVNINLQIHPGYEMVLTATPDKLGEYGIVCNEFCGIGHHTMIGRLYVVE
jgi:cytochrome c oxidase subunit 2